MQIKCQALFPRKKNKTISILQFCLVLLELSIADMYFSIKVKHCNNAKQWAKYWIDSSVKSHDHLTDNRNWPFKITNKVIVNVFS